MPDDLLGSRSLPAPFVSQARICFSPVKRLVARALCFDAIYDPVSEPFQFATTAKTPKKRARKSSANQVLVETEVRRSATLSALRDGFRQKLVALPQVSRFKKQKRALPAEPAPPPVASDNLETEVPPPTSISDLQRI